MALNISSLDAELEVLQKRAKLIQEIKRLAADPEAAPLLERLIGKNGHGGGSTVGEYSRLTLTDSVRRAITKLDGADFIVGNLGKELRAAGVDLNNIGIGKVLRRLLDGGEIEVVLEGSGSTPNVYRVTAAFRPI